MLVSPVWISAVSKSSIMPKPSESSACQPINERHGLCIAWRPPTSGPAAPRTVLTTSPHSPRGDLLHPRPSRCTVSQLRELLRRRTSLPVASLLRRCPIHHRSVSWLDLKEVWIQSDETRRVHLEV